MSNVDSAEVEKFDKIAHRFWDRSGEFKALHDINPLRLGFIEAQSGGLQGKSVVDIGCGGGILSEAMAQLGAQVVGVDMAKDALEVARLHALEHQVSVDYVHSTAEDYATLHPKQYDVVCCMEMLEHIPEPASVIAALAALVRADGVVLVSTLNRNIKSYLGAIIAAEQVLNLIPKGTHRHDKFIKPSELARWGRDAGLTLSAIEGISYHPFQKSYARSRDIDINYMAALRPDPSER